MLSKGSVALVALALALVTAWTSPAEAGPATAQVHTLPSPGDVVGEATLTRTANGASFTFSTTGLTGGHAYTIWFVAFNNPENCTGGCGADDLSNPAVQGSSLWSAGHVVGRSGKATFGGHRVVGDRADTDKGEIGPGLLDAHGAEIHLVLRTHGEKIPRMVADQIHSFNGGCRPGEPNEGRCANVQFAVFLPAS